MSVKSVLLAKMSEFGFLCLLVHHGVWNKHDHDVFKSIISTCKRIHQYVCSNKPLVHKLFESVALWFDRVMEGCREQFWILDLMSEGKCLEWFSNGQLHKKSFYRNDVLEGEHYQWYDNGQLAVKGYWQNGKREKEYVRWYDNGRLEMKASYNNDNLNGEKFEWTYDGHQHAKYIYRDGHLQSKSFYFDGHLAKWYNEYETVVKKTFHSK